MSYDRSPDLPQPEPSKPARNLLHDDIENRRGNYILTIGFPGAGKTTFQSFMMRYIMHYGPFRTDILNDRNGTSLPDFETNRIVTEWMTLWNEGRFPEANPVGENAIRELGVRVTPLEGVKTSLDIGMLEISGEMMESVIPRSNNDPGLSRVLQSFLANENIKLVIIFLINPQAADNDALFVNFMNYMDVNLPFDLRQRASLSVLVTKPEDALAVLKSRKPGHEMLADLRGETIEQFVDLIAPATYRMYYNWPNKKRKMLGRFYIGDVEVDAGGQKLVRPDYRSAENVFGWIYEQFTGRRLGPNPLQRLASWLKA